MPIPTSPSLAEQWDQLSLEIYGPFPEEARRSAFAAHRAFHHGALAALLCLQRGAKREDLIDEALAVCRAQLGTLT
jgi:hypothetical protein